MLQYIIRRVKPALSLLLVVSLLVYTNLLPTRVWAAAGQGGTGQDTTGQGTNGLGETDGDARHFEQQLQQLKEAVRSEVTARNAGHEGPGADAVGRSVKAARAALQAQDRTVRALLSGHEQVLRAKGAPRTALERQRAFVAQYETQMAALDRELTAAERAPGEPAVLDSLLQKLREATPSDRQQPLGSSLPFQPVHASPVAPPLGAGIAPAYAAGAAEVTAGTATTTGPTAEDLAETPETRRTEAITALAAELNNDPVAFYEYVRNQIRFTPYGASRKGAEQTLAERSGNAWDQASLLIALLRSAGYGARYVTGTVEVPAAAATAWTATSSARAALELLSSSGIAASGITAGGDYSAIRVQHVWVEAFVPLDDYRGQALLTGESAWQPFDPAYKAMRQEPGLDIPAVGGLDPAALFSELMAQAKVNQGNGSVTGVADRGIQERIDAAYSRVQSYLATAGIDPAQGDRYIGHANIAQQSLGISPLTLPYQPLAVQGEFSAVPAAMTEKVSFGLSPADPLGMGAPAARVWEASTAELAGKKLTLSWRPATADDEATIAAYGSIWKTPPYLIKVTPELKLDGHVVAGGPTLGLGEQQTFTMSFTAPGGPSLPVVNSVAAGSYYAVALDLGNGSQAAVSAAGGRLQALQPTLTEQNVWSDESLGEMLHLLGLAYFGQVDAVRALLARSAGIVEARHTSAGLVAADLAVSYLFFAPVSVRPGGLHIDVDRDLVSPVSQSGDRKAVQGYMVAGGAVGSAYEHLIFEQMTGTPALSAMKVFELARQRGVPIYSITAANVEDVLPLLQLSEAVQSDIRSAALSGKLVFAPQHEVQAFNWKGAGYVIMDPETGAAGYMISGGWAGGATDWPMTLVTLVAIVGVVILAGPLVNAVIGLGLFFFGPVTLATGFGAIINALLIASTLWYGWDVATNAYGYWHDGDDQAGRNLVGLAAGTVFALAGGYLGGKAIGAIAERYPGIGQLVERAFTWLDAATYGEASRLVSKGLSRELVVMAAEASGPGGLPLLTRLGDEGLISFSDMSSIVARGIGPQELNTILRAGIRDLTAAGINTAEDAGVVAGLLGKGFAADDLLYLAGRGIRGAGINEYGILSAEEAGAAVAFLRQGAVADDLLTLSGAGVRVQGYAGAGITAYEQIADAAYLIRAYKYVKLDLQRGVFLVQDGSASVLREIQTTFPTVNVPKILAAINDLAQKYQADVFQVAGDAIHALPPELQQAASGPLRVWFSKEQVLQVAAKPEYITQLQGNVGELQAFNLSERNMKLKAQWPGPELPFENTTRKVDVVALSADGKQVVVWEARNYHQGSFDSWKSSRTRFDAAMEQDFTRFEAARNYYAAQGITDYPTYLFADNTWDPAVGAMIRDWYAAEGWTINIVRYPVP